MSCTRLEIDGRGVATLWLTRAEKHNALSAELIDEIHAGIERLGADEAVRVVVLAGEGRSFCAGGDLGWMQEQMAADGETRAAEAWRLAEMLGAVNVCPKPVIGRIHGNAFGGGVGMACVCDVAVAAEGAKFGFTETRLGLIPATIGPYVLARMGEAMARRVFMSARIFGAAEAVTLGVVGEAVPEEALDAAVERQVRPYLDCATGAVAEAKALALRLGAAPSEAEVEASVEALVRRWESAEAGEGIAAFFDKRKAPWKG
ncbi:crotonase/enoyl-CoA hydratase family protein [Vannielia litorea]|uniref:crotonase/enoyl-CoA hydratase family protein n=1 Tax=Vannielia litorea TaxID=1217970 RepID=UPI001C9873B4|nr:crotonase/enoyl-CoA hydratase family protein [Vannielia litorea]MBY6046928.1 crotonase/enoyl-CoA hydratase family protein [Vannielia litorea]MBY6074342.1 crotonase/enoyl-CoA hydratase family protein [Vannielia litorea]